MMRVQHLARTVAAVAACVAGALIVLEVGPMGDIFLRADPTLQGAFSSLHLRGFLTVAAHGALIALALQWLFAPPALGKLARAAAWACFGALALELLTLAPCVAAGGALCGVFYIVASPFTALVMLIAFGVYLTASGSRGLACAAALGVVTLLASALAAYWLLTPQSPVDCERLGPGMKRDNCVMNFALQTHDDKLCDTVNFDSSRWSCTYQIAERKGDAALCERIVPPCRYTAPGPACEPDRFRDTCYLVVARKLHDAKLCERVRAGDMQANCRKQMR
jgi:hypothetical protein